MDDGARAELPASKPSTTADGTTLISEAVMHVVSFFFALVGAASVHSLAENVTCQNPVVRQEWRQLSEAARQNYLDAVKCLKSKPSRLGLKTPLYDDFPYVHARLDTESESGNYLNPSLCIPIGG